MAEDPVTLTSIIVDSLNRVEGKVDAGLSRIEATMEAKADKSDLAEIRGEIKSHGVELSALKESNRIRDAAHDAVATNIQNRIDRRTRRTTLWLSFTSVLAVALAVILPLILH